MFCSGKFSWEHVLKYARLRKRYISLYASLLKSDLSHMVADDNKEIEELDRELDIDVILQWRYCVVSCVNYGNTLGRRSVKGEGRRRRGHSKKRVKENRENLDVKPFLNLDPTLPSLDDLEPGGNSEAAARAAEEAVSFIASFATLGFFAACFAEGRRHLRRSPYHDKLLSKVFHTDLYRPYRVVCTSPLGYRYVDCPLSGGIAKIDHRRSIEGERGKKKKKRKRRMRKEEKKKEYLASSSPVRRRCPRVARAPPTPSPAGRPRAVVALARDFSPTRGERSRRPGFNRDLHEPALTLSWNMDHHWLKLPMLAGLVCLDMPAVNIRYSGMSTT
ncbi:hypothetical protein GW17_00015459 [Ensete ventricosum]|nr:hypothetical protein GW17_00015459 [Ensete ventricosum]